MNQLPPCFPRCAGRFLALAILTLATGSGAAAQSSNAPGLQGHEAPPFHQPGGAESEGARNTFVDLPPAKLLKAVPELKHLQPEESQDVLPQILMRVGATVASFFDTFSNVTCKERVISALATRAGEVELGYDLHFNYVALPVRGADRTSLREFRTDSRGAPVPPQSIQGIVTVGFVSDLKHFHPDYQSDARFRYLGREVMNGQDTHVVAFAQRPAVARHPAFVELGEQRGTVFVQGVAWIDPESFRILRLWTDILQPELSVGLLKKTTDVEYSEVTFKEGGKTLWLPREATVSGQMHGYTFHNHHHYSDYRLFSVKAEENQKGP